MRTTRPHRSFARKIFQRLIGFCIVFGILYYGWSFAVLMHTNRRSELQSAIKEHSLHKVLHALGVNRNDSSRKQWKPIAPGSEWSSGGKVPLVKGLTVVTAITEVFGDFESIKEIKAVDAQRVDMTYSADIPVPASADTGSQNASSTQTEYRKISSERAILRGDLESAHEYMQDFSEGWPQVIPNTTAISFSSAVLNDLKSHGETSFAFQPMDLWEQSTNAIQALQDLLRVGLHGQQGTNPLKLSYLPPSRCTLKRAEERDVAFPVLLNDQRVTLPAVHAACRVGFEQNHFYFLDEAENPLVLAWQLGENGDTLQAVKISFPSVKAEKSQVPGASAAQPPNVSAPPLSEVTRIEEKLGTEKRVEIQGIYFDFASDKIGEASEPVLKDIGEVLRQNPGWNVTVEGHTDNIGTAAFNQDLSQRRAAAVKQALVERYHIGPDRLDTVGYGFSRPKESNDTLEGRARNRRVELVRQ